MLTALLLREALAVALIFSRIAGFVLVSPFPGNQVPRTQKVALVVALSFFSAAIAAPPAAPLALGPSLLPLVFTETAVGIVIGFTFRVMLAAAEITGEVVSQATGLNMASVFNPTLGGQETVLSRLVTLLATLLVLTTGTHRVLLAWLMDSFVAMPVGTDLELAGAAPVVLDLTARAMEIGLRLAMPVVAVGLLVQIALAMIARIAPSLQVFNIGFALFIAAGLLTLSASLRPIGRWLAEHLGAISDELDRILLSIHP